MENLRKVTVGRDQLETIMRRSGTFESKEFSIESEKGELQSLRLVSPRASLTLSHKGLQTTLIDEFGERREEFVRARWDDELERAEVVFRKRPFRIQEVLYWMFAVLLWGVTAAMVILLGALLWLLYT